MAQAAYLRAMQKRAQEILEPTKAFTRCAGTKSLFAMPALFATPLPPLLRPSPQENAHTTRVGVELDLLVRFMGTYNPNYSSTYNLLRGLGGLISAAVIGLPCWGKVELATVRTRKSPNMG